MGVNDRNRLVDGYLSTEGGMDSGRPPALIAKNALAWAVNCVFRDGWPEPRPGWVNREMEFGESEELRAGLEDGYFQGAGTYRTDDGRSYIAASVSGRVFTIEITDNFRVAEITIPGDPNQANSRHAWFEQAETWLIVQNNENPAFLFNGAGSRRAADKEVPVGGPMAYGKGRLWVARGSQYFGGDLVYSDPTYGRDSVIRFTENTFLNEGGAFSVPEGPVSGMAFAANLDTSLGDGDLLVGTHLNVHSFNAPIDRDVWKNMEQPLQRYAAKAFGPVNHESMVLVNGDVMYRSPDGIRSLQYSRRDFSMWGQTPISRQVNRALRFDTGEWLSECSGVNFDNRMLMTIQPQLDPDHGVWHRGLVSIDFHRVTGMDEKLPPVWEGVWTGLRILRILTVEVDRVLRCFILALSDAKRIQLWEVTKNAAFDRNDEDNIPIQWITESRGFTFDKPTIWKNLEGGALWFDRILGEVSLRAFYRADDSECWHNWDGWNDCAEYRTCTPTEVCESYPYGNVRPIKPFRSQFRPYIGLTRPPEIPEGQTGGLTSDGFEFQVRFECTGRFRMKRMVLFARELDMPLWGDTRKTTCPEPETGDCSTGTCASVACCDKDDYSYLVNSEDSGFPSYPGYPSEPYPYPGDGSEGGDGGGEDGGGSDGGDGGDGSGDGGSDGSSGDSNPVYDPLDPGGPPPTTDPCSTGTIVYVDSNYVWGLNSGQDPNSLLTQSQIDCHSTLHDVELQATIDYYEGLGYSVSIASSKKWVWYGYYGSALSMLRKATCDPNDGIEDHYIIFNGYQTLQQALCVTPP